MQPIEFKEGTHVLGAGDNPNTGAMHVVTALDPETLGVGFVVSCWEPSEDELAELITNKKIYLTVMCNIQAPTQPPICAMSFNPFVHYGWKQLQHRAHFAERMFLGKIDIALMEFELNGLKLSMSIESGADTFILKNVVDPQGDYATFGTETKQYYKAWEILSAKYKEI